MGEMAVPLLWNQKNMTVFSYSDFSLICQFSHFLDNQIYGIAVFIFREKPPKTHITKKNLEDSPTEKLEST